MTLEDDLRAALRHHADGIEPADDGLERIRTGLTPATDVGPRLAPRLLVAAVLLVVVGIAGALTFRSDGNSDIDLAIAPSTTDPAAADVANDLPPIGGLEDAEAPDAAGTSLGEGTPGTTYANISPAPAGILSPRSATPEAAVDSFLGLIQRSGEDVVVDVQGDLAGVTRQSESGASVAVTTLQLGSVEMPDGSTGFVVIQATSPRIVIDAPTQLSTSSGSMLSVNGQGEGFEAVVDVELYSSRDGVFLNRAFATAGTFGTLAPFETTLDVSGSGPAWVVVQSAGGEDTDLDPFSAVPIVIDAPLAGSEYVVTDIPDDDPDGGLVIRSLPGTDGAELGVLPPGQRSIHKRAALSAFIGDGEPSYGLEPISDDQQEWWNIWLPTPLDGGRQWGWVNSGFLTQVGQFDEADLLGIGEEFVSGLRGDDAAFAGLPWSAEVAVGLSSDIQVTTGDKAANPDFWRQTFSFTPPPALSGTLDGNLRQILSPTRNALGPDTAVGVAVVPIAELSPYTVVNDGLSARFAGSAVVQLTDPTNDGSGWRLVNLFFEPGANGVEITGIVAVEWTP